MCVTGENYRDFLVCHTVTVLGTVSMSLAFRTKMTISPTQIGRDQLMLKSDHFLNDFSPKHARYHNLKKK